MTVIQLMEKLKHYPENMDVFMAPRKTEFTYGLVNSITHEDIDFMEEPGGKVLSSDEVVILDEE
jgi:hypothetical protein